ncbi:MAG: tripartite tricarboxylate transporter substrate binding protein [Hyphomicrobiales bacterium]|nr:tripartite tricarboxylate transporter substrate binding protein [Hyphomicrobiales bacterium]
MKRRRFLQLTGALSAAAAAPRFARAQAYPIRPVRWIIGFAPGGAADMAVRLVAEGLSTRLGQQVMVDNRPGAGTNLATEAVVRAPADGYTIMLVTPANAVNATLYEQLSFNFQRDIAPVAGINSSPIILVMRPSSPIKSIGELIDYARANPGKLNMATGTNGTANQMTQGLFKMMAGVDIVGVPYRGEAPAIVDLLAGQVDGMFITLTSGLEFVRDGRLRALAVASATRSAALPHVPTIADSVPGFESSTWNGVGAPRNTPPEIVARLNRDINATLADAKIKARFEGLGAATLQLSPAEFGKHVEAETAKWGKVVKFLGLKPN